MKASVDSARRSVSAAGQLWKLRLVADADQSSPRSRRELRAAIDQLDSAIATLFDAVYLAETRRKG